MREVEARLKLSADDKTGAAFGSLSKKMENITRRAESFNRQQSIFAKMSTPAMSAIARFAAPAAIAYGAKQAITSFAEMERHMTRIGITAEASKDEVRGATEEVKRLSAQFGYGSFEPAINALDTLTASGMNMKEALQFLPSVMATAQASGAATEDIANSGLKAASAFKLQAKDMQTAFDHMAFSGKMGQFELKDMALYIPSLASSFATLGYKGQEGLDHLLAIMQVIRAQTGTAEGANSNAMDLFGKITSPETINKFKKFGVDLNKELKKATANGEDLIHAFVRLTKETIHGDLSKLPQLFQNEQARMAVIALINNLQKVQDQIDALNSKKVNGTVMRDVNTVLDDTQTKLDRLSLSWDNFQKTMGGKIAPGAVWAMDTVTNGVKFGDAKNAGMEKLGWSWPRRQIGPLTEQEWLDVMHAGNWDAPGFNDKYMRHFADSPQMQKMLGRSPTSFAELPPIDHGYTPTNLPKEGPYPFPGAMPRDQYLRNLYRNSGGRMSGSAGDYAAVLTTPDFPTGGGPMQPPGTQADGSFNAFSGFEQMLNSSTEKAGSTFGAKATENLESDAAAAGTAFGRAAADALSGAIRALQNASGSPPTNPVVNVNVGKSNAAAKPTTFGGGGW